MTTTAAHYYRAEVARMMSWRDRLDRTSNWAITVVAALLSVSLSTPTSHHSVLLFAMLIVSLLLYVEARRYRFYDVYRMRVRQFERHYFAPMFSGATTEAEPWLGLLADDLRHPRFHLSVADAITARLRRNYIWMFGILLLGWLVRITSAKLQTEAGAMMHDTARPLETVVNNAALGPVPGALVIGFVTALYVSLLVMSLRKPPILDADQVRV